MPKIGKPQLKIWGSWSHASEAFTELGPPDIIIALKQKKLIKMKYYYSNWIINFVAFKFYHFIMKNIKSQ